MTIKAHQIEAGQQIWHRHYDRHTVTVLTVEQGTSVTGITYMDDSGTEVYGHFNPGDNVTLA